MPIPLEQFVDQLRAEMATWSTIEVRVHEDQEVFIAEVRDPCVDLDYHYIDARNGHRYLDYVFTNKSGFEIRLTSYSDGSKCARVFYDASNKHQAQIGISKNFADEARRGDTVWPIPLYYFYVGKTPLYEALPRADWLAAGTVLDRPCERFLFKNDNAVNALFDRIYYLDEQTGIPLRVESYPAGSSREPEDMTGFWEAKSLDEVEGGHHLPLVSTIETYGRGEKQGELRFRKEVTVKHIRYDHEFPASTFWPKYEPGVQVVDSLKGKVTQVPGPKREVHTQASTKVPVEPPGPVEQPRDWMTFLPAVVVVAGLGFLASAIILKRSRG